MKPLPKKNSPVLSKLFDLLDAGEKLHKHQVAKKCSCHHYTAMRYLDALHEMCVVRICGWHRCFGGPIPKYELHDGKKDAPMIDKLTPVERQRKLRKKPATRERERIYALNKTRQKWALEGRVRMGFWGV